MYAKDLKYASEDEWTDDENDSPETKQPLAANGDANTTTSNLNTEETKAISHPKLTTGQIQAIFDKYLADAGERSMHEE